MIQTIYNPLSNEVYDDYMTLLINKIYKILPLKEEHSPTVVVYIESLLMEMTGNGKLILLLQNNGRYIGVVNTIESLKDCEDLQICKREIFKCIREVEKLKQRLFKDN